MKQGVKDKCFMDSIKRRSATTRFVDAVQAAYSKTTTTIRKEPSIDIVSAGPVGKRPKIDMWNFVRE